MTTDDTPLPVTFSATSVIELASLLTEPDEFLSHSPLIADDLASFLARRGHTHPRFSASNFIDEASFTTAHLRTITFGTGKTAAECAHLAAHSGDDYLQER